MQRVNPQVRIVAAIAFCVLLALSPSPVTAAAGIACGGAMLCLSRPPLATLIKRLAVINVFIGFLWCLTPWTTPGQTVAQMGPLSLTLEGLRLSLLVTLKTNAIAPFFIALIATMDAATLGNALQRLGLPQKLTLLFLFAGRYVHLLFSEWDALLTAARLRGFAAHCDLHSYKTIASLLGLLFVRCHDRAQRVHEAMLLRGFDGRFRSLTTFQLHWHDAAFALFSLALLALLGGTLLLPGAARAPLPAIFRF